MIRGKSNADSAVKLVAFCQVLWFVAQSIMRAAHGFPLSQLESMTLIYIPLFAATYFFWRIKPKDIKTPSVADLLSMLPEQRIIFESMAVSNKFDNESLEEHVSLWNVWYLTPRVFEKEGEDKRLWPRRPQRLFGSKRASMLLNKKRNQSRMSSMRWTLKKVSAVMQRRHRQSSSQRNCSCTLGPKAESFKALACDLPFWSSVWSTPSHLMDHYLPNGSRTVVGALCCTHVYFLYAYFHAFRKGRFPLGWPADHDQSRVTCILLS
jgi:hypothetical protein